ncbi:Hypothetical_protein [Hexamita inflata]|uniref:Hypothetical_protein n=1 Tax=Hexamita inflata TaxID=28002 RepID=A0AA86PCR3_9EUKA|nr:Hypothetical protein HINF_LOCUS22688 [Hexamita inflata]
MFESVQQIHCRQISKQRIENQKLKKQRQELAKSRRAEAKQIIKNLKITEKYEQNQIQQQQLFNKQEQLQKFYKLFDLSQYIELDRNIAVLQYLKLGNRGYQYQQSMKHTNIDAPSVSSVRAWKAKMSQQYIAQEHTISMNKPSLSTFDVNKLLQIKESK